MKISVVPPVRRLFIVLVVALLIFQAASATEKTGKFDEARRVRFLIVADTDAREGAACKLDADNLKAVLEAGLKKQKLDGRYTIDTLAGRDVAPGYVLRYYQELKVGPKEALVFYYSGHGAYDKSKGHLLTFHQGDLARSRVLAAMQKHKPRLAVLLTDCCATYEDVLAGKTPLPTAAPVVPGPALKLPGKRGLWADADPQQSAPGNPPRPADYKPPSLSTVTEFPHPPRPENYRPPPPFDAGPDDYTGTGPVVLRTGDGPLPLKTVVDQTDGDVMRDLFYRHTGLVDISGCQKGKHAYATVRWGGGLFTVSFLSLQKDKAATFDTNRNGLVEWSEFFSSLEKTCDRAGTVITKGRIRQIPEATKLGQPSLVVSAK